MDPWMWCTCTNARVWCESMASSSRWLHALVDGGRDPAVIRGVREERSTSAPSGALSGAIVGTTTTRIPAAWSASNSW
jgi:hypothetical protein